MKHEDIPLHPAVHRRIGLMWRVVEDGLNVFLRRYGTPEFALRSNYTAGIPLEYALTMLRRLQNILLYLVVSLATGLAQTLTAAGETQRRAGGLRARRIVNLNDSATWRLSFPALAALRVYAAIDRPQPAQFAPRPRDKVLLLARRLESLRRVLVKPMPLISAIARKLASAHMRDYRDILWRPPKRPPPTARRDYWGDLEDAWDQASYLLRCLRVQQAKLDSS